MDGNIREYSKIGLVHHMLYPGSTADPDYHADTLEKFVARNDIEALDCCLPYGEDRRQRLIGKVRGCGKDIAYALHLFPNRKISLASLDPQEKAISKIVIRDQVDMAAAIKATGFVFVSGADLPGNRPAARESFKEFCRWFCGVLKPHGITALLEPFDREIDKKFLYGPISECVELMEELEPEVGNIGIELDAAHLPLMFEDFKEAISACGRYIKRVHLGNCILKDKKHPLYGDMHPPFGIEGGEIDVPELKIILESLLKAGYLDKSKRNPLIIEMIPFPGKSVEYTIADSMKRLDEAWKAV